MNIEEELKNIEGTVNRYKKTEFQKKLEEQELRSEEIFVKNSMKKIECLKKDSYDLPFEKKYQVEEQLKNLKKEIRDKYYRGYFIYQLERNFDHDPDLDEPSEPDFGPGFPSMGTPNYP